MIKSYFKSKKYTSFFIIFLALSTCSCNNEEGNESPSKFNQYVSYPYAEIPKDSSIILWRKPGVSAENFERWKKNHNLTTGIAICPFCADNDLELYQGVSIELFGGTGGNTACSTQTPPCKPSGGGDDTVEFCYNFPISIDTPFFQGQRFDTNKDVMLLFMPDPLTAEIQSETDITGPLVNVGIFDTGVDPSITTKYTTPLTGACEPSAAKGWNFSYKNAVTDDDFHGKHGTTVAKFIVDQVVKYRNQKVNIIPIKIFDSLGNTSLYNILCAFVYAQKSGIQIINASFGFYWHDLHNPPFLFNDFVKTQLTDHGILLIAAAGNRDLKEDKDVVTSGTVTLANLRNLANHPCYPAALAGQPGFDNVIAVTTASKARDKVSPQQNYSSSIVDIGVNGDVEYIVNLPAPTTEFGFEDPFGRLTASRGLYIISGSSYATPIITGKIAANYNLLVSGTPINKTTLLSNLQTQTFIHGTSGGLSAQVRAGNYADK